MDLGPGKYGNELDGTVLILQHYYQKNRGTSFEKHIIGLNTDCGYTIPEY
jgi:hypothetical protein